jgi:murein DD-endopeptidase MepM/ murein hydrolase activator NlpD
VYRDRIKRKQALTIALGGMLLACLLGGTLAARAPAQDPIEKFNQIQSQLDDTTSKEGVLTTTISRYNDRIDSLRGEIADLRNREAVIGGQLATVQADLDQAEAQLAQLQAQLARSIQALSDRLVAIYKNGEPDLLTVVLSSHGFDELVENGEYFRRLEGQDSDVIGRVRDLRSQTEQTVSKVQSERDQVAARKAEIDKVRDDLLARNSDMRAARDKQRKALDRVKRHHKDLDRDLSKVSDQVAEQLGGNPSSLMAAGPIRDGGHGLIWPVNGPITSPFGPRNIGNGYEFHPGVDIGVPTGTPIRAAAAGTVTIAGPTGGYGNYTCIDHGGGMSTCYGHQESFAVVVGMRVSQGQVIGLSDCTGYCFGPHVHFEVRINGQVTNPLAYF